MATIKSFTDFSQSKTLSKILPLESADMYYMETSRNNFTIGVLQRMERDMLLKQAEYYKMFPCWSLASLLDVLEHPRCFQGDKPTYWFCGCFGKDKLYHEVEADNPVDACYEMILKLHKLKML